MISSACCARNSPTANSTRAPSNACSPPTMSKSNPIPATFTKFLRLRSATRAKIVARLRTAVVGGLAILLLLPAAQAGTDAATPTEETLAQYPWPEALKDALANPPLAGRATVIDAPADASGSIPGKVLRVSANKTEPLRLPLLTVPNPPVTADFYALSGQVRYEGMDDRGYLEMWSTFPALPGGPERSFFSRTMGETTDNPMEGFRGTSGWRPVILPFNASAAKARPIRLTVNLILPAGGTVYLSPLRLAQYHYGTGPVTLSTPHAPARPGWKLPTTIVAVFLMAAGILGAWHAVNRRRAAEWRRLAAHAASTP